MKIVLGILGIAGSLFLLLRSWQDESQTVRIYDEFTSSSISGDNTFTGAKVALLENIDSYSMVKILSCEDGKFTELARHELDTDESKDFAFSLRIFPGAKNKSTWSFRYRGNGFGCTSMSLHSETLTDDWKITGLRGERGGSLREKIEVLDSFVLFRNLDDYPVQSDLSFEKFGAVDQHQTTSKKYPKIRIILLTLE